jgi:hypothetical protein
MHHKPIAMIQRSLIGRALLLALISSTVQSFIARKRHRSLSFGRKDTNYRGDPVREATGIRPSLHPLTINILADALKIRARNDTSIPLYVAENVATPLQVAMAAGQLAGDAIQKRQVTSQKDNMSLTIAEQETVAGRVVGVVMRLPSLESQLWIKCSSASWVDKYDEWHSFGVLKQEGDIPLQANDSSIAALIQDRIQSDPLFVMHRAECLLALFLHQIEAPELARRNATVSDQSTIDFLDADRQNVLLGT